MRLKKRKYVLSICCPLCLLWFDFSAAEVLQPAADYREFRLLHLPNGVQSLLVHHPRTTESGYAVAINAGSFHDPVELPGLAHFLEHMLFLGTTKYPKAESYDNFMAERGGVNNAYTDEEKTVFFNQVADQYLEEALDRFSHFFKSPLFNSDYEKKEVHAVNAEHEKNLPNEDERTWFVIRSLARGPLSRFATGNTQTLETFPKEKGISVLDKLKAFYHGISPGNANFLGVNACPGGDFERTVPFDEKNTGKFVHLQSFGNIASLWIVFSLSPTLTTYKKQPMSVLSYLFEYPGEGSLARRLRHLGLGDEVEVVVGRNSLNTLFAVKVSLTFRGAESRGRVLEEVFKYINLLRREGISSPLLTSMKRQAEVDFHASQPDGNIMEEAARLAHNLLVYEPYHVLAGDMLILDPDPLFVNQMLQHMRPDRAIIAFSDPNFRATSAAPQIKKDPYYHVEHTVLNLSKKHISSLRDAFPQELDSYRVPPAFQHVPAEEEMQLLPDIDGLNTPENITEGEGETNHSIWWQGLGSLPTPRIFVSIKARIPQAEARLEPRVLVATLLRAVAEKLEEDTVDLSTCGVQHELALAGNGFRVDFGAYTKQQLKSIMQVVAAFLKNPGAKVEEKRFQRVKQHLIENLESPALLLAYEHALEAEAVLLRNDVFSKEDLLRELRKETATFRRAVQVFQAMKAVYADVFVMGNIDKRSTADLLSYFFTAADFSVIPLSAAAQSLVVEQVFPVEALIRNPIPTDNNHATLINYQLGVPSIEERVNLSILSRMFNRKLYDSLRTEQQMGYIVGAHSIMESSVESLRCLLEGSVKHPDEVAELMQQHFKEMQGSLDKLSDEELAHWKDAAKAELRRPAANFMEEFGRSWRHIANGGHCFKQRLLELEYLERHFSKTQLLHTYRRLRDPSKRLVVKLVANLPPGKQAVFIGTPALMEEKDNVDVGETISLSLKRKLKGRRRDKHRKKTKGIKEGMQLQNLDAQSVMRYHRESVFYPEVTVCELASSTLLQLEEEL